MSGMVQQGVATLACINRSLCQPSGMVGQVIIIIIGEGPPPRWVPNTAEEVYVRNDIYYLNMYYKI